MEIPTSSLIREIIVHNPFFLITVVAIILLLIIGNMYLSFKTVKIMDKTKVPYQLVWLIQAIILHTASQILLGIYLYNGFGRIYINYIALLAQVYYLLFFTKFRIRDERNHRKIIILFLHLYICFVIYYIFDDAYAIRNPQTTYIFMLSWVKAFRPIILLACPGISCVYLIVTILKNNYNKTVKREKIVVLFTTIFLIISIMDTRNFPLYFIIYQILSLESNRLLIKNVIHDKGRFLDE